MTEKKKGTKKDRIELVKSFLRENLDPAHIEKREGGGGKYFDYLDSDCAPDIITQIQDILGEPIDVVVDVKPPLMLDLKNGSRPCFTATCTVTIPGIGTRTGVGTGVAQGQYLTAQEIEMNMKGCASDSLKRALVLFGVASDLYPNSDKAHIKKGEEPSTLRLTLRWLMRELGIKNDQEFAEAVGALNLGITGLDSLKKNPKLYRPVVDYLQQQLVGE